jgi:hypothetical protein
MRKNLDQILSGTSKGENNTNILVNYICSSHGKTKEKRNREKAKLKKSSTCH